MNNMGSEIRLHSDADINYVQAMGGMGTQISFTDQPDEQEITRRVKEIGRIFPEYEKADICAETVAKMLGVTDTLEKVKTMIVGLSILLAALITVLMERSFISKEKGEIALMKAIGTGNSRIYMYHALRFLFVGLIAVLLAE